MIFGTSRTAASIAAVLALVLGCMPAFSGARAVAQPMISGASAAEPTVCEIGMADFPYIDYGVVAVGDSVVGRIRFFLKSTVNDGCNGYVAVDRHPAAPFSVAGPGAISVVWATVPSLAFAFVPRDTGYFRSTVKIVGTMQHPAWAIDLFGRAVHRTGAVAQPRAAVCTVTASSRPGDITFTIEVHSATYGRITIADRLGRTVAVLSAECAGAGATVVHWPTAGIARGPYLYRVEAAGTVTTGKVVVGE